MLLINCTALNQSESSNFFMYVIMALNVTVPGAKVTNTYSPYLHRDKTKTDVRLYSLSPRAARLAPNTFRNQNKQCMMKIVTGFKNTCEEILTNFKSAIGSNVVSSQLGAQFLLRVALKFCYSFLRQQMIL